jgi:polyisoprenyl-phosphate glycosyltransferase
MAEDISVIIPAYNESDNLCHLVLLLDEILHDLVLQFELIVVDDGSVDDTWNTLKELPLKFGRLRAIRLARNFGKEAAIYAGLKMSCGSAVIVMDADLQHPPEVVREMVRIWQTQKVPIVEGVRKVRQSEPFLRRWAASIFYYLFLKATGLDLRNSTDFKLLDRSVVDHYLNLPERGRFFRGMTHWLGFNTAKVSFSSPNRYESTGSRWSLSELFDFARSSLMRFTTFPIRIITWLGVATLILSIILGVETLWMKMSGRGVEGFTTVILVQLGIGSVLIIGVGLIGEYLACVFEEVKARPLYTIAEVSGFEEKQSR